MRRLFLKNFRNSVMASDDGDLNVAVQGLPATWVVLFPGAAQQSTTCQPAGGPSACAGMQLALLCSRSGQLQRYFAGGLDDAIAKPAANLHIPSESKMTSRTIGGTNITTVPSDKSLVIQGELLATTTSAVPNSSHAKPVVFVL